MSPEPTLVFVSCGDQGTSLNVSRIAAQVVAQNRNTGLRLEHVDVDKDAKRSRELGVMTCPALVLEVSGQERGQLVGAQSRRAVLHVVLPELYDQDEALVQLRRQLNVPGEQFPKRALKRRERVGVGARASMLRTVPLFADLTKRELNAVARAADETVVEAGTVLTQEGEPGDQFFMVATGELEVRRKGRRVATMTTGDCFGEVSLLDGGPRTATVTAATDSVLLALDAGTFRAIVASSPSLAMALLEVLAQRLRNADPGAIG